MPASLFAAPIAGVIRDDTKSWKWMIVFAGTSSLAGGLIAVCGKSLRRHCVLYLAYQMTERFLQRGSVSIRDY